MLTTAGLVSHDRAEPALNRIRGATGLHAMASDAVIVIEAAFEDLSVKQRIFGELDRRCLPHTMLASNTSSLMPSQLAAATKRPDKVMMTHHPPRRLPLGEIVRPLCMLKRESRTQTVA